MSLLTALLEALSDAGVEGASDAVVDSRSDGRANRAARQVDFFDAEGPPPDRWRPPGRTSREREIARQAAWSTLATRLGGQPVGQNSGSPQSLCCGIDIVRDAGVARVESHLGSTGGPVGSYSLARAPFVLGAGPTLSVAAQKTLARVLGGEDVVLGGDAEFDERFVIRCHDGTSPRALSPAPRDRE